MGLLGAAVMAGTSGASSTPPVGASGFPGGTAALRAAVHRATWRIAPDDGSLSVHVDGLDGTATGQASMRLVPMPPGAAAIEVTGDPADAGLAVAVGTPMTLRGTRVAPVRVVSHDGVGPIDFELRYVTAGGVPLAASGATLEAAAGGSSHDFLAPFRPYLAPGGAPDAAFRGDAGEDGAYIIITHPDLAAAVEPLAAWKREMGLETTVATSDVIGSGTAEIRSYLRDLYQNAPSPPRYVLIVGDVEQIPAFFFHSSVTDHPYAMMDDADFLPDLEVGRLPAQNATEAETMVAKILVSEQDPEHAGSDWFDRGIVVGGDQGSLTPVPVSRWCRELMLANGYAEVDTMYWPAVPPVLPDTITAAVSRGVSLVSYRGWAYGSGGWHRPSYSVENIPALTNSWMLPAVFSFVCHNNEFDQPNCFGEAWLRAGSAANPTGAVAFIGNSSPWSHTRFNDASAIGAFHGIVESGIRQLGQILNASKAENMAQFFTQMLYDDPCGDVLCESESVEYYFYIYNLLGDPSMEIWFGRPVAITVEHPATLPQGASLVEVRVTATDGGTPVAGSRVGLSQGDLVLGCARTDANGYARILTAVEETADPVRVAVTGGGVLPYRQTMEVTTGDAYLAYSTHTLLDDGEEGSQGNGDGIANPGETLAVSLELENRGSSTATGISAQVEALRGATVVQGLLDFPAIAPGATAAATTPCLVSVPVTAADGEVARLRYVATSAAVTSTGGLDITIAAPGLHHVAHAVGEDGVLAPGETTTLDVTLGNDGSLTGSGVSAVLRAGTPAVATVDDSTASFGTIAPGAGAGSLEPFTITAAPDIAIGRSAAFTLVLTTVDGYRSETSFSILVGDADHRAPVGPDAYGYHAVDNTDTDYPATAPTYDWIECSPAFGGSGTRLALGDNTMTVVTLPFDFTFYGDSYRRILICDNGWASFDTTSYFDWYNWSMPTLYGNGAQLAPFWDNLDPTKQYEGTLVGDGIYVLDDSANDRFVVEWSRLGNERSQNQTRPDWDDLQTFEIVLYDPAARMTPTGDGIVGFQYKQVVNNDSERMYATVGIEDATEKVGLELTYSDVYATGAAPLSAGLAIEFTTERPRYSPFTLAAFSARSGPRGIELAWEPIDGRPRGHYQIYRAAAAAAVGTAGDGARVLPVDDPSFEPLASGRLGPAARGFVDTGAEPDRTYLYVIGSTDPFGVETRSGPYSSASAGGSGSGAAPPRVLALRATGLNPFHDTVRLAYDVPRQVRGQLAIYDVAGRLVRVLAGGELEVGRFDTRWDGRDRQGRPVASGIYFGQLMAGGERRTVKLTLMR
jgi:hypothetical protein